MELRDVNNDGKLDIIATTDNGLLVRLGNGDGTFAAGQSFMGGSTFFDVQLADLNRDGVLDIVAGRGSASSFYLFGNGDGSFKAGVTLPVTVGPGYLNSITIADFNRDGVDDIAIGNNQSGSIDVLLGNQNIVTKVRQYDVPTFYSTGDQPFDVQLLDLNRDGRQDLVTVDRGSNTVSVQLGNGNGSFKARLSYATGTGPVSLEYADVNGDGRVDLVTVDSAGDTVSVLYGNADGSFQARVSYAVGVNPSDVAIVDFDRDGKLDLIVSEEGSDTVSVLLGNGDGSFSYGPSYAVGAGPRSVQALDFNRDGIVDIATLNRDENSITVIMDNTDGIPLETQTYSLGNLPAGFTVGDINGDGRIDIAAAIEGRNRVEILFGNNYSTATGTFTPGVSSDYIAQNTKFYDLNRDGILDSISRFDATYYGVRLGNGDGSFLAPVSYAYGGDLVLSEVRDINGDGSADLIMFSASVNRAAISLGNTDGSFKSVSIYSGGGPALNDISRMGDLNGDGIADLVTSDAGGNSASVLLGNADGSFKVGVSYLVGAGVSTYRVELGDFNRDGILDIVATANDGGANAYLLQGNGNGTFGFSQIIGSSRTQGEISVVDFDNDGIEDILIAGLDGVTLLSGNGDNTFSVRTIVDNSIGPISGRYVRNLSVLDIDGDGKLDIVGSVSNTNGVFAYLGNGDGTVLAARTYAAALQSGVIGSLTVADLNRDGVDDIFVSTTSGGVGTQVLLGNRQQKVLGTTDLTFNPSGDGGVEIINGAVSGDLNGDGFADLIVTSEDQNSAYVSISNGDGTFLAPVSYTFSGSPSEVRLADVNGDGIADMVLGTDLGDYEIRLGNGDGTFKTNISFTTLGAGRSIIEVGDLNDDGSVDIIAISDNQIGIAFGNGDGSFKAMITQAGSFGNISQATVRDLDGDGDTDLIIQQSNGGGAPFSSIVFMSNGNGTFLLRQQFDNAAVASGNFLADVNSDGIADLVTSYETGGVFEVALGNGNGSFKAVQSFFTGSGRNDVAVADMDGDGNADVITTAADDGAVFISFGNGDGTFKVGVSTQALVGNFALSINDFNGDALPDIFVGRQFANEGAVLLGNGNTDTNGAFSLGGDPRGIVHGFFDWDSNLDFAVLDADGSIKLFGGNGDGTFRAVQTVMTDAAIGTNPVSIASGDFNGDGIADFAVNTSSSGMVEVLLGNGDGTFKSAGLSFLGGTSFNMLSANVTGSTAQDLILADSAGNSVWVLEGNGDGTFKARVSLETSGVAVNATVGDVNRDGTRDIVSITDAGFVEIALANSDGTFSAMRTLAVQGGDPIDVAVGDVDGDLIEDIIVLTGAGKTLEVFKGNGDGSFSASRSIATVQQGLELQLLDLNTDGLLDIVAATSNPLVTNKTFLEIYLNQGSGTFATPVTYEQGPRPLDPIIGMFAADINKDGVQDLYTLSNNPHVLPFEGTTKVVTTGVVDVGVGQEGKGDPLRTTVSTAGNAAVAFEAISKLQQFIEKDLKGIRKVLDDLKKAQKVARAGVQSSERLAQSALAFRSAGALAEALRNAIRVQAPGASLNSISGLDTKLVNDLLKDK